MTNTPTRFPVLELVAIIITYLGLLLITASSLVGTWSAVASLTEGYLFLIAPFVMGIIDYQTRKIRQNSALHRFTFYAGALYFVITPVVIGLLLLLES
jgi:uncharacterized membrane protein SirB2